MTSTDSPILSWVICTWVWNDKLFLLCSRYPSNLQAFSRSRLPGPWDSSRAGKRMKLSRPDTWERELSSRGNKASVWEELIGRVTLTISLPSPFMPLHFGPLVEDFYGMMHLFSCLVVASLKMIWLTKSAIVHLSGQWFLLWVALAS